MQLIPMALPGGDAALFDQYQARASAHRPRRSSCAQSTAARARARSAIAFAAAPACGSAVPARVPFAKKPRRPVGVRARTRAECRVPAAYYYSGLGAHLPPARAQIFLGESMAGFALGYNFGDGFLHGVRRSLQHVVLCCNMLY